MSDDKQPAPGLRGRRRSATAADVETAALAAFTASDFDRVTMDQVAAAAGVSVRTAFRYFPTKIDTVLHTARQISARLSVAMETTGSDLASLEGSIAAALSDIALTDDSAIERLRQVRVLMIRDPRLRGEVAKAEGNFAGLAATAPLDLEQRMRLEIVAATLRAAFDSWATDEGDQPPAGGGERLVEHYRQAREIRGALLG